MCTSVPQTPARRTRIRTSSSRILGSSTSFNLKPGAADSFTSAFTSCYSVENREEGFLAREVLTCQLRSVFGSDDHVREIDGKKHCTHISCILYSRRVTSSDASSSTQSVRLVARVPVRTRCRTRRFHLGVGESSTSSWRDKHGSSEEEGASQRKQGGPQRIGA